MNTWPVIDMAATGQNIARLRRSAGLTVRDLQDIFGFANPQAIYRWQRGEAMPTVDNLVVLAAVFGVTIDDILVCAQQPGSGSAHKNHNSQDDAGRLRHRSRKPWAASKPWGSTPPSCAIIRSDMRIGKQPPC